MTDLASAADRIEALLKMEVLTEGEVGVGTRFRETRVMFKKEHSEEMEISAFDPPRSYTTKAGSAGAEYTTTVSVKPAGGGSELEYSFSAKPISLMAKLMSPLGFLMKGMLSKALRGDLESIKRSIEAKQD